MIEDKVPGEPPAKNGLGAYRHIDDKGDVRRIPDEVVRQHIAMMEQNQTKVNPDVSGSGEIAYLLRHIRAELREANARSHDTQQVLMDSLELIHGEGWREKLKKQRGAKAMLAERFNGKVDPLELLIRAIANRT